MFLEWVFLLPVMSGISSVFGAAKKNWDGPDGQTTAPLSDLLRLDDPIHFFLLGICCEVSLPPFESWCPKGLESHAPKLPEAVARGAPWATGFSPRTN